MNIYNVTSMNYSGSNLCIFVRFVVCCARWIMVFEDSDDTRACRALPKIAMLAASFLPRPPSSWPCEPFELHRAYLVFCVCIRRPSCQQQHTTSLEEGPLLPAHIIFNCNI